MKARYDGDGRTPRLALTRTEAAQALGISVDFFDEHVAHELRCVRRGRRRLYPIGEIERWLERAAERVGRVAAFVPVFLWNHRPGTFASLHVAAFCALNTIVPVMPTIHLGSLG